MSIPGYPLPLRCRCPPGDGKSDTFKNSVTTFRVNHSWLPKTHGGLVAFC